jgi:type II secretory pathway component PulF
VNGFRDEPFGHAGKMRNATPRRKTKRPGQDAPFVVTEAADDATLALDVKFSSKNLAAFYYQLGTLVQAGVPIRSALQSSRKTAPRAMRSAVTVLSDRVNEGAPLHEGMERCGQRFAPLDKHVLEMSGRGGALDSGLLSLSKYYETRAAARNKLIAGSMYPSILLIVAVFGCRFPAFFLGAANGKPYTLPDYLRDTVGVLGGLALIGGGALWLLRWSLRAPGLNVTVDRLLRAVPVLGRLRFDYALSRWVSSICLMLRAGIGVVPALEDASRMADSPLIAHGYQQAAPLIASGLQVSQALAQTDVFPDYLIQFWATGEQSGRMDDMLERLEAYYQDRWRRSLDQTVTWVPRIAYALVALYTVYQILNMYNSYFSQYNELLR